LVGKGKKEGVLSYRVPATLLRTCPRRAREVLAMRVAITASCILALALVFARSAPCLAAEGAQGDDNQAGSSVPLLCIVAPEDGCHAEVGDTLHVMLVASETLNISALAILCDSRGVGMLREPPYVLEWDTSDLAPGAHVLRATAYLRSGEKVEAEPRVVTFAASVSAHAPEESQPKVVPLVLKEGTPVVLETTEKMVSGHTKEGSIIRFKVTRDVVGPGHKVLISYGDFAQGKVTRSRRRGAFGKAGQLEFSVDSVTAADGTTVPLRASEGMQGKNNKGVVVASALLLTVFTVFIHGKDDEVPPGTEFVAYVDHDAQIGAPLPARSPEETRLLSREKVAITSPASGRHVSEGSKLRLVIAAEPANSVVSARVTLDGRELAVLEDISAPIMLPTKGIQPGEHELEVEATFANGARATSDPVEIVVVEAY
jgi:hypothetical protein